MKKKNDWIKKGILIIVLLVCIAAYLWVPGIHKTMNRIFKMFASGDFTVVRDFVASYGVYAALISFLLMIFQSIAAPLPAFLITFANASLFGWWKGAILSWSSAMAGAAVCFYIAKILGRDVAEKLTSKTGLEQIDTFFERYGKNTILIFRLYHLTLLVMRQALLRCHLFHSLLLRESDSYRQPSSILMWAVC